MRRFIKRALLGALVGGGLAVLGAGVASAAETSGDDGLLSGTQGLISVELPVTVGGNAISVLGDSSSRDAVSTTPAPDPAATAETDGSGGTVSGTQAVLAVTVPITLAGNGVSVIGDSASADAATAPPAPTVAVTPPTETSGEASILGGTQALVDAAVPVTVGGNAISVLGDSRSSDAATAAPAGAAAPPATGSGSAATSGDEAILGGTQVQAPVTAPVSVGGNAISVLGDSTTAGATTVASPGSGTAGDAVTGGDDSVAGGTQVLAPIAAPVTAGGNAVSVIGDAETDTATTVAVPGAGTTEPSAGGTEPSTDGEGSTAGGTQVVTPVAIPVTVGGNAVCGVGDCSTADSTTVVPPAIVDPADPGAPLTPADPADPATPADPTMPGAPPAAAGPAIADDGVIGAPVALAASTTPPATLADTGGTGMTATLLMATLLLVSGAVLFALRRATA
ncbi:DUF320 domain-containing protein [Microbacterium sp. dk485]|uniref:chaplin family protein n=1 Tax=Microbacterium sp. dk485 TaxID=2560021 RepID=UPI001074888D|nr:chaplin family protein [Microbacterium sp. dk485]TFV84704.1 DUF320 domain-containing protein [Microbacterium sp. dk485]